jgi:hypothetical protein
MQSDEDTESRFCLDRVYCRNRSSDGRICVLYKNHHGKHAEKHLKSYWSDDE